LYKDKVKKYRPWRRFAQNGSYFVGTLLWRPAGSQRGSVK